MAKDSWNPQQYDKFKKERSQPFYDLMDLIQPVIAPRIVDLGCGTGELTAELHKKFSAIQTLGLDNSTEMLKKAPAGVSGLSFEIGNIENWNAENKFDIVFSNAAIQWCKGHPQILSNIKNSLRHGGQLAVQMPMNHDYITHTLAERMAYEPKWLALLGSYEKQKEMLTAEAYAKVLFDLGFQEQKVFVRVYGHVLDSRDGVIEWVKGTLLTFFKSNLSEQHYQEFLVEFKERLFKELPDEKPFFYPFKRIFLWAR